MTALKTAIEQFTEYLRGKDLFADSCLPEGDAYDADEVSFASERAYQGFVEQQVRIIQSALLVKFQEIVAPALDAAKASANLVEDGSEPGSYILREGADGVWIRIRNIDARIRPTDEGVVADLYPAHLPTPLPLASAYASFAECEDEQG